MSAPSPAAARNEMLFSREIAAPREAVFAAWSQARQIDRWFGPRGFVTVTSSMDFRPGGVWSHTMTGPDGKAWPSRIRYVEIVAPARIVYDHHGPDLDGPAQFRMVATFTALPGSPARTRIEMRGIFPSAEIRDRVVRDHKAEDGGRQTLERLAEHLASVASAPHLREAVLRRTFAAPRAAVFHAWVDPAQLGRWWGPRGFTNPVCEIDARVGGRIRIDMRAPDGTVYPMTGTVEAIEPPARLVMRCQALDQQGRQLLEVLNTATFADAGGGTTVEVRARVLAVAPEGIMHVAGMEQGWSMSLDRLEELVSMPQAGPA